ncbi:MAG: class III signal peptide-containing protein [Elusimicrobia bacterium]|nr:class III signal peptide-containing protein [Elusimicrobiota bacterium]
MKIRLSDLLTAIKLRVVVCGFRSSSSLRRRGQTTVEYLLMLAVVVGMALTLGIIFYKHILGLFYTMVGMVLGAGEPT